MNLKQYEKMKKTVDVKSFEAKYGVLDKLLNAASFLGNFGSIFFAFFFISKLLHNATDDFTGRTIVIGTVTVIAMSIFELLKRYVFRNLSLSILSKPSIPIELFYNGIFSVMLIAGSFYLSLNGAKEFADKSNVVKEQANTDIVTKKDSVFSIYESRIDLKYDERTNVVKTRDIYVKKLEEGAAYSTRLREYNKLIKDANDQLAKIDNSVRSLESERDSIVTYIRESISNDQKEMIDNISRNKFSFLLISSFIEILILVGVYFHTFFGVKVFNDFKRKLVKNPSYGIYDTYNSLLTVLFKNGKVDVEEVLPPVETITRLAKNRGEFTDQEIADFLELCENLKITIHHKEKRIIAKHFGDAKETLMTYFDF